MSLEIKILSYNAVKTEVRFLSQIMLYILYCHELFVY
jgi:hypothetical protein